MDFVKSKIQKRPPNLPQKIVAISQPVIAKNQQANAPNQPQIDRKLLRKQIIVSPAVEPLEAKMRINQKLKELKNSNIRSCQPTPKMTYKKIP